MNLGKYGQIVIAVCFIVLSNYLTEGRGRDMDIGFNLGSYRSSKRPISQEFVNNIKCIHFIQKSFGIMITERSARKTFFNG
jgi:hypothetical protein